MSEIKPIRSEADYEAALAEVERLWGARSGTAEGDRLDVLATLIDAYENEHHPIDPPDPIEAIKFRMEQQGLGRKDVEGILGTRTRVAEVLNRRRRLSINMIRRLHEKLGLSAEVLIRPYRAERCEEAGRLSSAKSSISDRAGLEIGGNMREMSETLNAIFEMVRTDRARGVTPRKTNAMRAELRRRGLKTFSQGWLQGARSAADALLGQ